MTIFYTLVTFAPQSGTFMGSSYRNRDVRSYGVRGQARANRTRFANEAKRRGEEVTIRILRTTIHDDGTTEGDWVE